MSLSTMQSNVDIQFATWIQEEKSFRAAVASADKERASIEEEIRRLRALGTQLSTDSLKASDVLGSRQGLMNSLKEDQGRLQKQLAEQRTSLEQCTNESRVFADESKNSKAIFCKEAEALNTELSDLLVEQEERSLERLITMDSVEKVFGNSMDSALQEAVANFKSADAENDAVREEVLDLRNILENHRIHALKNHKPPLTENDLVELERMWESNQGDEAQHPPGEPVHNELFYGSAEGSTTTVDMS